MNYNCIDHHLYIQENYKHAIQFENFHDSYVPISIGFSDQGCSSHTNR